MTTAIAPTLDMHRKFYADYVTAKGAVDDPRLTQAFHMVDRAKFCGPGPWWVSVLTQYLQTPSDDPIFLYQDVVIGLLPERGINNGEPSLHARCLSAVAVQPGDTVIHVGTGTGYYSALLATLVGPTGFVHGYEIEPELAQLARQNLAEFEHVLVHQRSGAEGDLPKADVIYVCAGATEPMAVWLDSLKPGGRLLFPLTPDHGFGGMLLVTYNSAGSFDARFIAPALFFPCIGARNATTARALWGAFRRGNEHWGVRSLRRTGQPDASSWAQGDSWWLSTDLPRHD